MLFKFKTGKLSFKNASPHTESAIPADDGVKLERKMTLINGITLIVGSMIGSGIFISPTGVLLNTGSVNVSLIVWICCGVITMIGAYCYAELGTMIRTSGAEYSYIMTTFGPFMAFLKLWIDSIIIQPCSQAIVALTFAVYVLKPLFTQCSPPEDATRLLAAWCILLLAFVNCWNVRWATAIQDWFTYAKLFALIIIIGAGMYQLFDGHSENFTFDGTTTDVTSIALAFYSGLFAFGGWNSLNFIIEELKDPVRNLPRAIAVSLVLVTSVYVLTNVSFFTTLTSAEILASEAVAISFANRLFGPLAFCIPIFVAASTFGTVNASLLTASRLYYTGAHFGQMPELLTMIQKTKATPAPAVMVCALLSMLYLTVTDIYSLINYVGFASWLTVGCAALCIPVLRYTKPDLDRPIKVNLFFPVFFIITIFLIILVPAMIASPVESGIGCLIMVTAVPVYFTLLHPRTKINCLNSVNTKIMIFCQKSMLVVKPKST